jgi:hypothetical protein
MQIYEFLQYIQSQDGIMNKCIKQITVNNFYIKILYQNSLKWLKISNAN